MIERHRSEHRSITTERLPQFSQVKGGPDPRQATMRLRPNSSSNQARHRDWVLIAILIFVLFRVGRVRLLHLRHLGQDSRLVIILKSSA